MNYTFHSQEPIYLQLAEMIKKKIIRRELEPGDKLPSVRDMAVTAGVNPNTVQRTYRELEGTKIVESKRGQGTFVTENEEILQSVREEMKEKEVSRFVYSMREMGYSNIEIKAGLEAYLAERGGINHD
ncbi:GntR family transcriptional regulator [Fervidibacillus albus]|uniref:GntR family transcriptional regulator n=1 Tax=Fervidibacillus albus TaxID=2980026 RepID=A0A9E8LUK2_9BACI|nr:GntR family transcriptional regulator [Fervidibacillus albus]WAA09084.1 GntR family transcriptional regulator [Fervidibacillus albus]